ncbi:MAG: hypothetical protein GEEBNDBF_00159 [bacterium]|nr:hypothetical protein [bacterium]
MTSPCLSETLAVTHGITEESPPLDLAALRIKAASLAPEVVGGGVLALTGPLGAGKTTVVQALVQSLGYQGSVKSPSFVLQHLYQTPDLTIEHWDLYRLLDATPEQVLTLLRDIGQQGSLVLLEWPEPLISCGWGRDVPIWQLSAPDESSRILTRWEPRI